MHGSEGARPRGRSAVQWAELPGPIPAHCQLHRQEFLHGASFQEFVLMERCHHGCGRRQGLFSIGGLDMAACLAVWGTGQSSETSAPTAASAIFASVDQTDRANRIDV